MPELATAINKDNSLDQQIDFQLLFGILVIEVQLIPSGDVITLLFDPELDTATINFNCGDQHKDLIKNLPFGFFHLHFLTIAQV